MPDWHNKQTCILGCGNVLFGDDGFGPAVADHCQRYCAIPASVCVLDVGTSVRNVLFDILLADQRPKKIVIVDAIDCGREPGALLELDIESLPKETIDDFSMHQLPTSNLLREIRDYCEVEVRVLVCQVTRIPEEVSPGLSIPVSRAVERAAKTLAREHFS